MILYVSIIPQYLTFDWCLDKYLSVYAPFFVALAHAIILKIYSFTKMKKVILSQFMLSLLTQGSEQTTRIHQSWFLTFSSISPSGK